MRGQTSFETLIVLAAYLAFLGLLIFSAASLGKKLRGESEVIAAGWSAERVAALENFFIVNGRNAAWNESIENCSIGEKIVCIFGRAASSKNVLGGLNETEAWKQPV